MDPLADVDLSSLSIVKYPAEVLRRESLPVEATDERLGELAREMFRIMYAAKGVGLAAPQVGVGVRLFVANPQGAPGGPEGVFINPRIIDREGQALLEEGCLSVPGVRSRIKRNAVITVAAVDLAGRPFEMTGEGLLARIFQHEVDHLAGTLILNRMSAVARLANRRTIKDLEEEYAGRARP